jgi:hypothetical protein
MSQPSERGITPDLPIRKSGEGFQLEKTIYKAKLLAAASLPSDTEPLAHRIPWPVDMTNPLAHLTAYPDDPNYAQPSPNELHGGLDIQLPIGTPILAPEDATVVFVPEQNFNNKAHGMRDVLLYSENSGFAYWLVHLDASSLPERIAERRWFDRYSDVKVRAGEQIGTVGIFFNEYMRDHGHPELPSMVQVPDDVAEVYGRSYDHLHLEVHHEPNIHNLHYATRNPVNPLKILRRLY